MKVRLVVLAITIAFTGCNGDRKPATPAGASTAARFELDCDSSDTSTQTQLFCVRTDTRSGDIVRVNHLALPVTNGPTGIENAKGSGTFTTVCDAASTDTRSDFYCIRLDTESGEMILINLQKVGQLPTEQ